MADKNKVELRQKTNVPNFEVAEGSEFPAVDLNQYIENPTDKPLKFIAELTNDQPLPTGLFCSESGKLYGVPAIGTAKKRHYDVLVIVQGETTLPLILSVSILIYNPKTESPEYLEFYWQALLGGVDPSLLPDIQKALTRDVTPSDIYYLLGRFSTFIIWNADDLSSPDKGRIIELSDANERFNVYDFDVALVASPKDLYDPNRTLRNGIETAQAMIHEVQCRKWNIEFAGYDKLVRAAWLEVQKLNRLQKGEGHIIEVYHYEPNLSYSHLQQLEQPRLGG